METTHKNRRRLIKTLILSVISLPFFGRFLMPKISHQKLRLRVKREKIPGMGALIFRQKKIAVIKKNRDIFALNLTCPHLGCTVNATARGFTCPCHGSVFDSNGHVIKGPADRSLKKLVVKEKGDEVFILS